MKKSLIAATLAVATLSPVTVMAQAAPAAASATPTVGAKVFDSEGNDVGSIEAIQGDVVTVSTGTVRAGLPKSAFAARENGLAIGMTKAQLEAAVSGAQAQNDQKLSSALTVDAPVKSSDGVVLGTITKVEGDDVVLTATSGAPVGLKKNNLGVGADGSLAIAMTAAVFNAQVQAAAAQGSTSAPASTAGE